VPIFISYARPDRPAVEALAHDLEGTRESIWMDNELTGGQAWWDTILRQIRECDLFVLALSPESLRSRACRLELQYAVALRRPLLPVQIADLAISTAPQVVADTQIVDYRQRTPEAGFALWTAVMHRPPAPDLPDPFPPEPAPPMSYMHEFQEQVDATVLSYRDQNHLLADLRGYLSDEEDRRTALQLIAALRRRRDVGEKVAQEIDRTLAAEGRGPSPSGPARAQTPPQGQPTPGYSTPQGQPTPGYSTPQGHPTPGYSTPQSQPRPAAYHQQQPQGQSTPPAYQPPPQPTPGYGAPWGQPTPPGSQQPAAFHQPPPQHYPPMGPAYQPIPGPLSPPQGAGNRPAGPHPQGTVILLLAILGLVSCAVTSVVALVLASRALKEIDAKPGVYTNRSTITAARAIAWVVIGLVIVYLFYYVLYYGI
jgi:hypothetical protein